MIRLISFREIILVASLIIIVVIIFYIYTQTVSHNVKSFQLLDVFYIVAPLITGFISLLVAKETKFKGLFGISYILFAMALFMDVIGESLFIYLEILEMKPHPSIADVFYGSFFFFAGFFILINIKYFSPNFSKYQVTLLIWTVLVISTIYSVVSIDVLVEDSLWNYLIGLVFVIGSSIILGLALVGITIFEYSKIGVVWVILSGGLVINTIADVWFEYLSIFGLYNANHVVNSLWILSWLIISYALIKQYNVLK